MPRVARPANPTASSPATAAGTPTATSPTTTAPVAAPTSPPTSGAHRSAAAAVRASGAPVRTGSTVSQENASASPFTDGRSRNDDGLAQQSGRHLHQRQDGRRARAVAEPHAEVDQWRAAEAGEPGRPRGLGGTVGGAPPPPPPAGPHGRGPPP